MAAFLAVAALHGIAAHGCAGKEETSSTGSTSNPLPDGGQMLESCSVSAPTACPDPAPRYADITPVLAKKCGTCHTNDPDGPWPLTDYDLVASWAGEIRTDILDCSMPPLDAGAPLTEEESTLILTWVRCGALP